MALAIAVIDAPRVEDNLRAQGVDPLVVDWSPPAGGDLGDVALLTRAYADDRVEEGNRRALTALDASRPQLVDAGLATDLVPGMDARRILHCGPPCDWQRLGPAMRGQVARAAMLEGWAGDQGAAAALIEAGDIELAATELHGVVAPMSGVLSPSMAVWAVHDEATGADAWAPMSDGAGDGLPASARTRDLIARQRLLADRLAPGASAALGDRGPIDLAALAEEAARMGDADVPDARAAGLLLIRELLPAMATRALDAVPALAGAGAPMGRIALPLVAAAARCAVQAAAGTPMSSLLIAMSGNGTDVGVMLAGTPGTWHTAPAPIADDARFDEGSGASGAAPWTGDQGVIACATMAIDARLCIDAGEAPAIPMGIASRADGGWVGHGTAQVPLAALRDAVGALVQGTP
ncbi:MAG: DUF1116 domain-containing protein [Miltoncostaeaceae bacterium]